MVAVYIFKRDIHPRSCVFRTATHQLGNKAIMEPSKGHSIPMFTWILQKLIINYHFHLMLNESYLMYEFKRNRHIFIFYKISLLVKSSKKEITYCRLRSKVDNRKNSYKNRYRCLFKNISNETILYIRKNRCIYEIFFIKNLRKKYYQNM